MFYDLYKSLLDSNNWQHSDQYFVLKDFEAYREAQSKVNNAYKDELGWAKKCLMNVANAGKFSSDRTILEYAENIWKLDIPSKEAVVEEAEEVS